MTTQTIGSCHEIIWVFFEVYYLCGWFLMCRQISSHSSTTSGIPQMTTVENLSWWSRVQFKTRGKRGISDLPTGRLRSAMASCCRLSTEFRFIFFLYVRRRWWSLWRWRKEAPKLVKREPTHSTGLSLKLKLRLPCLRMFRVWSVRGIEKKENEGRRQSERGESGCF